MSQLAVTISFHILPSAAGEGSIMARGPSSPPFCEGVCELIPLPTYASWLHPPNLGPESVP